MNESAASPLKLLLLLLLALAPVCVRQGAGGAACRRRDRRPLHARRPERAHDQRSRFRRPLPGSSISATPIAPTSAPPTSPRSRPGADVFEKQDSARAARVQPIFVTVDPARDTPAVLKEYLRAFHPRPDRPHRQRRADRRRREEVRRLCPQGRRPAGRRLRDGPSAIGGCTCCSGVYGIALWSIA